MLVDMKMPEMSGADLLRHLAERHYSGAIILVSGADKDTVTIAESLAKYRELNVLGHIIKSMTAKRELGSIGGRWFVPAEAHNRRPGGNTHQCGSEA